MSDDLRGLANPGALDVVVVHCDGPVELIIEHPEPWDGSDHHQVLLQEKLNRYLEAVVDGELVVEHPEARGRPWVVVVECATVPDDRSARYLHQADVELRRHGGALVLRAG